MATSRLKVTYTLQESKSPNWKMEIAGSQNNNDEKSVVYGFKEDDEASIRNAKARLLELGLASRYDYGNDCTLIIEAPYTGCSMSTVKIKM